MRPSFDAQRIGEAMRAIESRSAAEIVVDVRARSGSYAHAEGRFAALLTLVSLVVLVYMPLVVPPVAVLLDAVAVYVLGLGLAHRSDALRRLCTTRRERAEAVKTHAESAFHHRGIANTSEETGVLLFVSLLEQRMEVLADRGVLRKVASNEWNAAVAALHEPQRIDTDAVIDALQRLAGILTRDVPAGAANADELTSTPEMRLA